MIIVIISIQLRDNENFDTKIYYKIVCSRHENVLFNNFRKNNRYTPITRTNITKYTIIVNKNKRYLDVFDFYNSKKDRDD